MPERSTTISHGSGSESPGLLSLLAALPGVSDVLRGIANYNVGPETELLERAAYFPLLLAAPSRPVAGGFEVESGAARRFEIGAQAAGSRLAAVNRVGAPAATVRFRWRLVPDDYVGSPDRVAPLPALPLRPGVGQRFEVFDWTLRFADGASGFRAYGAGRTLPEAGGVGPGAGMAFVLDVLEGFGQLAGLAGAVVASGTVGPDGGLELGVVVRVMDPSGHLLARWPLPSPSPWAGPETGVTYLAFLGQVDPQRPVTLRFSLTAGVLGSNVFELLRPAELDFETAGGLRSRTARGSITGSVKARLSFNPLALCPTTPVQTRLGSFELRDPTGRSIGSIASDMIEGRSFRTRLEGALLPVFRFAGFGPVTGGTGEFTGARGIMTMNSAISVQPRTLSNLYVLRLDDPDGRFRATAERVFSGGAS